MEIKYEIHTDLPVGKGFIVLSQWSITYPLYFGLNWYYPILEMDKDDRASYFCHAIKLMDIYVGILRYMPQVSSDRR